VKVFLAGATGVLGRRVVSRLLKAGHEVAGLSRSDANSRLLRDLGAEPRPGSLFDAGEVIRASEGCEAVMHLATSIPTTPRTRPSDWKPNDLIRRKGTKHLVEAALRHGCRTYVQQSVTLVYGNRHGEWVDESSPVEAIPGILKSAFDMEKIAREAGEQRGLPVAILRCGIFYCEDSAQTRLLLEMTEKGQAPVIGEGDAWWSLVHVDDAAAAFVDAIERPAEAAGGTFNICDDTPVRYAELQAGLAEMLGAKRPGRMPKLLAKLLLGGHAIDFLEASVRCRNGAARERLGWSPAYPGWREGFAEVLRSRSAAARS
jgi:nucleoside-diphosphate-sugar epimerase